MSLLDVEQIRAAKTAYARHCDAGYDPDGVASVFAPDGVWESDDLGVHRGRDAIREFMSGVGASFVWARHMLLNPEIEVDPDGLHARAAWLLYCPAVVAGEEGEFSVLMISSYDDRLVKVDGVWLFEHMHVSGLKSTVLSAPWLDGLPDPGAK